MAARPQNAPFQSKALQNTSENKMNEIVDQLARYVVNLEVAGVPDSTFHAARRCLVDVLGCVAAGRGQPAVVLAHRWVERAYARGKSGVWFGEGRFCPVGAAFVNASAASILDLDDGHRAAAGHPGAAIIPAVLAQGQEQGADLQDMLLAIVAGYQVGIACASTRSVAAQATVATGRWSAIGVAAALAKLRGFDAERTRHALTIAESHAPNLLAADYSGFQGGHVKEGIPWSVITGFAAAELAGDGFRGYDAAFSNPARYGDWGAAACNESPPFFIDAVYFKRYACCRWLHSAVDAASKIVDRLPSGARIQSIFIETFTRAATLPNLAQPKDLISAQFSLPFVMAVALTHGLSALLPLKPHLLSDENVIRVAQTVEIKVSAQLDTMYPLKVPARVNIRSSHGYFEELVISPLGDYDNPLSDEQLVAKALLLAEKSRLVVSRSLLEELLEAKPTAETVFGALDAAA
ncbi:MmgE/PrpD family protein [Bradyrhizobium sp. 4]|uniref:MmgE/PrpD family protein n=1 Tax=unclassified Bradyrhizobium TaxID=2631580 RepID=UPI001FF90A34|nr:MmgE/PrpD family protein [Bradyrhizobium sp. 4]MCK1402309.1 MmgE/PrpD family protein [Bradyrhizobium sp. 39]MCK1524992.1 MmgE/PrpD family protein [Bradyrhizobium sp. 17]MCK1632591.1 MmgE/PrpD family protein [Bradyrhizobium sp. 162]MCK1750167.1 MmgE/PrpD family protein [Bradyrhizobium sp. 135]UPJ36387.1 MmgE/PrpD family protein [Bradyrhizobium sp. 4]